MNEPHTNYITEIATRIRAAIDPDALPNEGLDQLFSSYALLALSKGVNVSNEDVHDAWSVWATQFDPQNDSILPYEALSPDVQDKDTVFRDAIREIARSIF